MFILLNTKQEPNAEHCRNKVFVFRLGFGNMGCDCSVAVGIDAMEPGVVSAVYSTFASSSCAQFHRTSIHTRTHTCKCFWMLRFRMHLNFGRKNETRFAFESAEVEPGCGTRESVRLF